MEDEYLYVDESSVSQNLSILPQLKEYADTNFSPIYVLSAPLTEGKYNSNYQDGCILLIPHHKIVFIDCGTEHFTGAFEDYVSDILEDVGSISDRFNFKQIIGRPRSWQNLYITKNISEIEGHASEFINSIMLEKKDFRLVEIIISLFIGSINNANNTVIEQPKNLLESIKYKIQLFDCDQTRFIYYEPKDGKKLITIQGLSGTGKTELLLHKLKSVYVSNRDARIGFTCYSKVLADSLRRRIPMFFDYMNVQQQIAWEERLFCVGSWGNSFNPYSRYNIIYKI